MKLIIREYLSSLREREELDAVLPDLLSELGYVVYSRPQRGTQQHGVDIAAVSPAGAEPSRVYLFSVKKGDLTRADWDGTPQALRPSLNEIRDVYIRTRIPVEYAGMKVVICLCFGGDMLEQVRAAVTGYIAENTTDRISFEEWNGDKIAGLLLEGVLREDLLPKSLRSSFQKAVAMLDEPAVAYRHFAHLAIQLRTAAEADTRSRIRAARQLYISVWVMFVWGREIENLEGPYLASELAILSIWEMLKPLIGGDAQANKQVTQVLTQLIQVHFTIASQFLETKIIPHVGVQDALAFSVRSQTAVDVNMKLFDILGRMGMLGLWSAWLNQRVTPEVAAERAPALATLCDAALTMIENNSALWLPICDDGAIDVAIFLQFWAASGISAERPAGWLHAMASRLNYTVRTRGRYPTSTRDYEALIRHPADNSDTYFEETMAGSTLIPLIAAWAAAMDDQVTVEGLGNLVREKLPNCTIQLWSVDRDSESHLYVNSEGHGRAICELPVAAPGRELITLVAEDCDADQAFNELSAVRAGFWPIVVLACRHWRLPVPPELWVHQLKASIDALDGETATGA